MFELQLVVLLSMYQVAQKIPPYKSDNPTQLLRNCILFGGILYCQYVSGMLDVVSFAANNE